MSSQTSNQKRSRWGDRAPSNSNEAPSSNKSSAPAVSDQEALEALLASSQSKEDQRRSQGGSGSQRRDAKRPRHDHPPQNNRNNPNSRGDKKNGPDYSYYGNPDHSSGNRRPRHNNKPEGQPPQFGKSNEDENDNEESLEKEKPNFGLSGALAQEQVGDLKFREPPEARAPNTQWRLYVFKNDQAVETLHISKQSAYLLGRNQDLADIPILHPSLSGQHAVLQYRALPSKDDPNRLQCKPYLMDLESTNGSFINGVKIDPARYYQLKKGDVLTFGASTREYVLLTENTTSIK